MTYLHWTVSPVLQGVCARNSQWMVPEDPEQGPHRPGD